MMIFAVGCSNNAATAINKITESREKIVEAELPIKLDVKCSFSNIEVYAWNEQQVKFEFTKTVMGNFEEQQLKRYLEKVEVHTDVSGSKVSFSSMYKKQDNIRKELDLRIYIPDRTEEVSISCNEGKLRICDHLKCSLLVSGSILDTTINKIGGKMDVNVEKGNIRVNAGKLLNGTRIRTEDGNVYVKTSYEPSGEYSFYSGKGVLDINIPKELNARIIDYLPYNHYDNDTMENYTIEPADIDTASFILTSGIEEINVTRF
jgi:hypothetical protein